MIGYVGRLTVEKTIRFMVDLEQALVQSGLTNFRFLVVGQGAEEPWLKANMRRADFTGVLNGEALAQAYANMDVFAFPSRTDTYGNVVLEALASGVPAVVTESGGPDSSFAKKKQDLRLETCESSWPASGVSRRSLGCCKRLRIAARSHALKASWDAVFETVYLTYERNLRSCAAAGKKIRMRPQSVLS